MKTMGDIETRLHAELVQWFYNQIREEWKTWSLYYIPTSEKQAGEFIIMEDTPANPSYKYVSQVRKNFTIEQNHYYLLGLLRCLPILSLK